MPSPVTTGAVVAPEVPGLAVNVGELPVDHVLPPNSVAHTYPVAPDDSWPDAVSTTLIGLIGAFDAFGGTDTAGTFAVMYTLSTCAFACVNVSPTALIPKGACVGGYSPPPLTVQPVGVGAGIVTVGPTPNVYEACTLIGPMLVAAPTW